MQTSQQGKQSRLIDKLKIVEAEITNINMYSEARGGIDAEERIVLKQLYKRKQDLDAELRRTGCVYF